MNLFRKLPLLNIQRKPGRSLLIALLIAILAAALFATSYLTLSMSKGMDQLSARLGADLIVIPSEAEEEYKGALVAGEPSTFYMGHEVLEIVREHPSVEQASPQLYLASLDEGCCSFQVQLMAIDYENDFSIKPWLSQAQAIELKAGQTIGGSDSATKIGDKVKFYAEDFDIVASLDRSGFGIDNTIIFNYEDGLRLIEKAKEIGGAASETPEDSISAVMVNVNASDSYSLVKIMRDLNMSLKEKNARVIRSNQLIDKTSEQITSNVQLMRWIIIAIWLVGLGVLLIIFPLLIKSRSKELALLRILGANKVQLLHQILKEISLLSIIGSFVGTLSAFVTMYLFQTAIVESMHMPFLPPTTSGFIVLALIIFIITSLVGPLVSLIPLARFNQKEIAIAAVEND